MATCHLEEKGKKIKKGRYRLDLYTLFNQRCIIQCLKHNILFTLCSTECSTINFDNLDSKQCLQKGYKACKFSTHSLGNLLGGFEIY
jgi:hypothetical protein